MGISEIYSVLIGIVSLGVAWGMSRAKLQSLEEKISEIRVNQAELARAMATHREKISARLEQNRDLYVTYQHFNEVIGQMREDHKELREDIKTVISLLNSAQSKND